METVRIKCPNCGAILTVADSPANIGKSVKCPVCKEKFPFADFKAVPSPKEDSDRTSIGTGQYAEDRTQLPEMSSVSSFGYLFDVTSRRTYPLTAGVNLVGRKTYQAVPAANIPIETDDLCFSRKHLYIEAVKGPDGIIRHYAYNAANKNETTINGVLLNAGDKLILHDSDVIESGRTTLVFKITGAGSRPSSNDSDKTEI